MFVPYMRYGFAIVEPKAFVPMPLVIKEPIYKTTILGTIWTDRTFWGKLNMAVFGAGYFIEGFVVKKEIVGYE